MEILGTKQELHRNNPGTQGGILRYDPGAGYVMSSSYIGESNLNLMFNEACYKLYKNPKILDLGCGGGGFIRSVLDEGHFAIGIDGFEQYELNKIDGWGKYPNNFSTLNISKPISVLQDSQKVLFDIVTAWEVCEHLYEDEIDGFAKNIVANMHQESIAILTISFRPDLGHFTIKPLDWWVSVFESNGLLVNNKLKDFFTPEKLVRYYHDSHILFLTK